LRVPLFVLAVLFPSLSSRDSGETAICLAHA
jgi:hypothetical protein